MQYVLIDYSSAQKILARKPSERKNPNLRFSVCPERSDRPWGDVNAENWVSPRCGDRKVKGEAVNMFFTIEPYTDKSVGRRALLWYVRTVGKVETVRWKIICLLGIL